MVAAAWADVVLLVAVGLLVYAAGVALVGWPLVGTARRKPPVSFTTWSLAAGMIWLLRVLLAFVAQVARSRGGLLPPRPWTRPVIVQ